MTKALPLRLVDSWPRGWPAVHAYHFTQQPLATDGADSLPRSPKGYELYSWYDGKAGDWRYVLITGTNRLKTHQEMVLGESDVIGDDWVSLTARGTGQLKALLAQLPRGEQVTWIGEEWLQNVGQTPGDICLPGKQLVLEIEGYCRQHGIRLEVTD